MDLLIGLDVSLATTAACVLDEHGKVLKESKVDSEPEALTAFLRELAGSAALIGLEAGPFVTMASHAPHGGGFRGYPDGNPAGERCLESHADKD